MQPPSHCKARQRAASQSGEEQEAGTQQTAVH